MRSQGKRLEAFVIGAVAGYELASFASRGRLPTVTALVMRLPHGPRHALIAAIWWWTVAHFELRRQSPKTLGDTAKAAATFSALVRGLRTRQ